jgi:hypothetical protein
MRHLPSCPFLLFFFAFVVILPFCAFSQEEALTLPFTEQPDSIIADTVKPAPGVDSTRLNLDISKNIYHQKKDSFIKPVPIYNERPGAGRNYAFFPINSSLTGLVNIEHAISGGGSLPFSVSLLPLYGLFYQSDNCYEVFDEAGKKPITRFMFSQDSRNQTDVNVRGKLNIARRHNFHFLASQQGYSKDQSLGGGFSKIHPLLANSILLPFSAYP